MAFLGVDNRGIPATAAGDVGDGLELTVILFDVISGAVSASGAVVECTLGDVDMTLDTTVTGRYVCSLTAAQVASIGAGQWAWLFRLTPADAEPQTYVRGSVQLTAAAGASGSTGWQSGFVKSVLVGVC